MSASKTAPPPPPRGKGTLGQLKDAARGAQDGEVSTPGTDAPGGQDHAPGDATEAVIVGEIEPTEAPMSNLARMAREAAEAAAVPRTAEGRELAERQHPAMAIAKDWLDRHSTPANESDWAVGDIIGQVLNAETPDEVLADAQVMGIRDMLGEPFTLYEAKFQRSDFEAGMPYYVVLSITKIRDGWTGMVTCGAQTIISQVMRLIQLGALPREVVCINARKSPSANGNMPLRLVDYKGPASQRVETRDAPSSARLSAEQPSDASF